MRIGLSAERVENSMRENSRGFPRLSQSLGYRFNFICFHRWEEILSLHPMTFAYSRCGELGTFWVTSAQAIQETSTSATTNHRIIGNWLTHREISAGMLVVIYISLVFRRFSDTPIIKASGRELSYLLLFGIFLSFSLTFVIVAKPTAVTCGLTRFFLGKFSPVGSRIAEEYWTTQEFLREKILNLISNRFILAHPGVTAERIRWARLELETRSETSQNILRR